nr:hypothetical protein [Morchella crassipes]
MQPFLKKRAAESVPPSSWLPPPPPISDGGGVLGIYPRTHGGPHGASKGGGFGGGCSPPLSSHGPPPWKPSHLWWEGGVREGAKRWEGGRCLAAPPHLWIFFSLEKTRGGGRGRGGGGPPRDAQNDSSWFCNTNTNILVK